MTPDRPLVVRDIRSQPWLWLHWTVVDMGLDPFEMATYVALCRYADRQSRAYPSQRTLAAVAKMSRSRLVTALRTLEAKGLLAVEARPGVTEGDVYTLLEPPARGLNIGHSGPPHGPRRGPPHGPEQDTTSLVDPSVSGSLVLEPPPPDGGRPKGKEPPDARVQPVIDAFDREHRRVCGIPYPVAGGRDGGAIKKLPAAITTPTLIEAVRRFFGDPYNLRGSVTIPVFIAKLGGLVRQGRTGRKRDDAFRASPEDAALLRQLDEKGEGDGER